MQPPLPGPEVHLWRVDLDAPPAPPAGLLSSAEEERRERLRTATLRQRWGSSRWALREVLSRYLELAPGAIELPVGEGGKPALAGSPAPLEFNLSHSAGLALVAVAGGPVGVDVESTATERDFLALAERALEPGAVALVRTASPARRAAVFYAAWTRHEARLKCLGGGIAGGLPEPPVAAAGVTVGPGYAAAVAIPGTAPPRPRTHLLELG